VNIVLLAGGAGIGLAVLAALYTAKSWKPTLWALGVMLSISPLSLYKLGGLANDTLFKGVMAALLLILWLRLGFRLRWPVGLMLGAMTFALVVSVTGLIPAISVSAGLAIKAYAGYVLPLAAATVRWRREQLPDVLQVLVALPVLSIGIGIVLQVGAGWTIIGDGRLGGALIGPTLALLSIATAFAAMAGVMVLGQRRWTVWLLIDLGIAFLTLTRGALLAAGILLLALGMWTFVARRTTESRTVNIARLVFVGAIGVALVALPEILARNQGNSYEGSFNTSGRDQAWPFYISLSEHSPLLGRGLGFGNIANALLHPVGVQEAFESPHNEYIHLWVDGGLLLAIPYFLGLISLILLAGRTTKRKWLALGILGATLVYCFVDNNFSTPQFSLTLGLLMAALITPPAARTDEEAPPPTAAARPTATRELERI
jgi:O-antigen ligase